MRILIYGGKGWIGQQFIDLLKKKGKNNFELGNVHCENTQDLIKEIDSFNPSHIVSFIGRTFGPGFSTIDYLEQPGKLDENIRDNLFCPLTLALLCKDRAIHFTYLGTGCIFNYDEQHTVIENPFTEVDEPNFKDSNYSLVKGYTDRLMHFFEDDVLNLRIRMPITSKTNPRNFITKITNYKKICSVPNSMTVLDDFLPIFLDMMEKKITGTYNCTNPGIIEHNEILSMYKEIIDSKFTWENFTIQEQDKILLSKRSNNFLDTYKISKLYVELPDIRTSVKRCLQKMKYDEMFVD